MNPPRFRFQPVEAFLAGNRQALQKTQNPLDPRLASVIPASRLERPPVPVVSFGIAKVDAITGGLPRGALTEICGPASSGRSSLLLAALAEAGRRQELCALVDTSDRFDPLSASAAGLDLSRLLWIRCGEGLPSSPLRRLEQSLKVTDLLLQGGGFGVVAIDMADIAPEYARRVPLASWFRFRRAVEDTPMILMLLEQEPNAKTCASLVLRLQARSAHWSEAVETRTKDFVGYPFARLLQGFEVQSEVVRSRVQPAIDSCSRNDFGTRNSCEAGSFETKAIWTISETI